MALKNVVGYKLLFVNIILFISLTISCKKRILIDPFWDIDLRSDISVINEALYEKSKRGEIVDCVFSFDKEFYIEKPDLNARINTSLDVPKIIDNNLKINYTIVTSFKNEDEQRFNPTFFNYFLSLMTNSYGIEVQTKTEKNMILLSWTDSNKVKIKVSVLKDINLYMVLIEKRI